MFLKSVELYGFKSFADRTKFEFTDGITSLLGPNGSGKSNVVDSIKWVLGSQSLSAVRAGKKEDVIFNGTDTRKPMPMCEVILTLSNEENLLNIEATEVEIKRRMFRNGDNEYYINRERALLRSVKELFMDTGVGKAAYSILEQGKIDQILSMKPEDRRYIFEEAAGISRFKQQSEDAARKLQKTDENMAQVSNILHEVEKIYNSRKIQMERLTKSRELNAKSEELEVELQLSYVQSFSKLHDFKLQQLEQYEKEQAQLDELLSDSRLDMDKKNEEIEQLRQKRERISQDISRSEEQKNTHKREIELLNERFHDVHERTKLAKFKADQIQSKLEKERENYKMRLNELDVIRENLESTALGIEKVAEEIEQIKKIRENYGQEVELLNSKIEHMSDTRNEITQKLTELANEIADRLAEKVSGSGYSSVIRSKAEKFFFDELAKAKKILLERLSFLKDISKVDFDHDVYLKALEETEEDIRAELDEIKGLFQEYCGTIPTFVDEFTAPEGTLAQKTQLNAEFEKTFTAESDYKARVSELTSEIQRSGNQLILRQSDLHDLEVSQAQLRERAQAMKVQLDEMKDALSAGEFEFSDASHNIEAEESKEAEVVQQIENSKNNLSALDSVIEQHRQKLDQVNEAIEQINAQVLANNSAYQAQFERKQQLMSDIATERANIENIDQQIQRVYTEFFESTGKSLKEFNNHEITTSVEDLKNGLETVKKQINDLGYINYMAEEEYEEAKKNYDFYTKNLDDLTKAKQDLEEVIAQIKQKSEEMFMETYNQISVAFEEMFKTLFGGGRAQLSLSDEENVLESGIEILAQPPGKTLVHLPLLSGGEKSMTAVALLFATYKVKPSPFCILDEIDAALDVRNIGAFMKVLEQFGDKSQFIIITHNKHTVMGCNCLLGITQEELGVSKMIGYKIDAEEDSSGLEAELK